MYVNQSASLLLIISISDFKSRKFAESNEGEIRVSISICSDIMFKVVVGFVVTLVKAIHIAFCSSRFSNTISVGYLPDNVKRRFRRLDVFRGKMFHRQF